MRTPLRAPLRLVAVAVVAVLAVVLAGCSGSKPAAATSSGSPSATRAPVPVGPANSLQQQYESVITSVLPSVVEITTSSGLGSGVVFDTKGDIVTNDHVVGNATSFQVQLSSRAKPVTGTLVGTFPAGDLAVIKISGVPNLHPAVFANSANVQLGEIVLAMGNPLGLASSVTEGIVSATGRTLTEPHTSDSPGATLPDVIQTSAAINPGNSGGALVDLQGQVIGIPTLDAVDQQQGGSAPGLGFAIPSNTVKDIAAQLVAHGTVVDSGRADLGVTVTGVTDQTGRGLGAGVVSVVSGGPADKAGIQAGDIITGIDGQSVTNVQQLTSVLANLRIGQIVPVVIQRNGTSKTVHVTLGQLPGSA